MTIHIINTTDHKYENNIINWNGSVDDLYLDEKTKIELIEYKIVNNCISLISSNYIIQGNIVEV